MNLIVIVSLFLTFCVLVYSYAYHFGSSVNPEKQKLKVFQSTKEVKISIPRKTKTFPNMKMMKNVTSEESMKISAASDIKSNNTCNKKTKLKSKNSTNIQRKVIANKQKTLK